MNGPAAPCPSWLQRRFAQAGGSVPFSQFMAWALHDPEHGAYGSGRLRVGPEGDFVTSANLGPDFSALLGHQVVQWLRDLARTHPTETLSIVDVGPGEAELTCDLIDHLASELPDLMPRLEMVLIEINPGMEQRQRDRLSKHQSSRDRLQRMKHRWTSISDLRAEPIRGVLIAHELFDAFPVERLVLRNGHLQRQTVQLLTGKKSERTLVWGDEPIPADLQRRIDSTLLATGIALPPEDAEEGWTTEWHDHCAAWFKKASEALIDGHLLIVDYALEAHRYYTSHRSRGTLVAYRNQQANNDVLNRAGEQDLTAHLCIESLVHQATSNGWNLEGECRQGQALLALGLAERIASLQNLEGHEIAEGFKRREALLRLVDPACLGEFRWLSLFRSNNTLKSNQSREKSRFLCEPSSLSPSKPGTP